MKAVRFMGDALDRLREFPADARREAGHQLDRVQHGLDPFDWKPIKSVGSGVREIRVREASGAFRVIYVTALGNAVVVLHCFRKTTQQTARADLDLIASRLRHLKSSLP